nr:PREDICTED: uncharacterized protein LOC109040906 isoform X1 [Bemisia tabaci]
MNLFLELRTAREDMKLLTTLWSVFLIGLSFSFALAEWPNEEAKKLATSLDASNNDKLQESIWPRADAKGTEKHTDSKPYTSNGSEFRMKHHSPGLVPSSSEFSTIRNSRAFVDKTLFLHEWLTHRPKHWYVTAPPGFGKSALAKMAVQFLNASFSIFNGVERYHEKHKTVAYELFKGTNIFEMKEFFNKHFQNYSVIYVDLAPLSNTSEGTFRKDDDFCSQDIHKYFKMVIKNMMSYYPSLLAHQNLTYPQRKSLREYLEEGMETRARPALFWNSVSFLRNLLKKCLKKDVIVIIDSYDALCKPSAIGEFEKVLRPYLASYIINFNKMIVQSIPTRTLYFGTFNTVELMLMKPYNLTNPKPADRIKHTAFSTEERIAKYFGLSQREVTDILTKYSMEDHLQIVNNLLNGHAVLRTPLTLFNTKHVFSYIENRNSSPSAFFMPFTDEILHHYEKLFTSDWLCNVVTKCIYKDKTEIMLSPRLRISFATFRRLTASKDNITGSHGRENLSIERTTSFIKILQFLGLISAVRDTNNVYDFRASSQSDAELLSKYLYRSNSIQKLFRVSAEDELAMIRAFKGLSPNNDSVQCMGEAIKNILTVKFPDAEYQLKFLVYAYARKVAARYNEDFAMEAGIVAPTINNSVLQGSYKPSERIDLILVQKKIGVGVILTSKFDANVTAALKEMSDRRYFEILDSDPCFSRFKIKDKMLIGISVSRNKSVEIAAEVWSRNEKTSLQHVILNIASQ